MTASGWGRLAGRGWSPDRVGKHCGRAVYPGTARARRPGRISGCYGAVVYPERRPRSRAGDSYETRVPCCRRRRGGCHALRTSRRPPPRPRASRAATKPPAQRRTRPRRLHQNPTSRPSTQETVVVSASRRRGEADQRPGDDERDHQPDDRDRADRRTSPSCCARFPASTSPRCRRATST